MASQWPEGEPSHCDNACAGPAMDDIASTSPEGRVPCLVARSTNDSPVPEVVWLKYFRAAMSSECNFAAFRRRQSN
eukprot:CAMPEP_0170288882 /NCGR_PEP_ID=MMETSP0116_2-20130129/44502_1 /TAXON_ID=400756 /ORGANISM="Durinskia baltica, Strain CSIRO CS-38" /LENGTH=75 /DNA_ID=CAMNT_0010540307 /DNA_START=195 /DNA_END=422 /DNA_ORIENTATION=+